MSECPGCKDGHGSSELRKAMLDLIPKNQMDEAKGKRIAVVGEQEAMARMIEEIQGSPYLFLPLAWGIPLYLSRN